MKEKGSAALILVLTTLAIIISVVVEIKFRSELSASIVGNRKDGAKAYELARSAFRWALFRIQLDTSLDRIPAITGTNYGGRKDDLMEVQWAMPIPYPFPISPSAIGAEAATELDLGGSFTSAMTDESSKLNLNDIGSGGPPGNVIWSGTSEVLENLLLSPRFRPFFQGKDHRELLWAIDDYTDSDGQINHIGGGVEDVEYQNGDPNFHVKNGSFYSVEEVRLLKPMREELYRELRPFITVYPFNAKIPRVSIQPVTPIGRINVNTAPMELIAATISQQVVRDQRERLECAQKFMKARSTMAFRSIKGLEPSFMSFLSQICRIGSSREGDIPPVSPIVQQVLDVRSDVFAVEATGLAEKIQKTIRAVVSRTDPTKPKILYWKVI